MNTRFPGRAADYLTFAATEPAPVSLEAVAAKIKSIKPRNPAEYNALVSEDKKLCEMLFTFLFRAAGLPGGMRALLQVPENETFDVFELKLAGWVLEVQKTLGIPYREAAGKVLSFVRRNPRAMYDFTGQDEADFSEFVGRDGGFAAPSSLDLPADQATVEAFRRARIYQAAHPGVSFAEAVGR